MKRECNQQNSIPLIPCLYVMTQEDTYKFDPYPIGTEQVKEIGASQRFRRFIHSKEQGLLHYLRVVRRQLEGKHRIDKRFFWIQRIVIQPAKD